MYRSIACGELTQSTQTGYKDSLVQDTGQEFVERIHQLYEQSAMLSRIGDYVRRWLIWVRSGLRDVAFVFPSTSQLPLLQVPPATVT